MIVLSVDIATGKAALFGIPRNLINVPLAPEDAGAFPDGRFPGLLNALYVYAWGHPGQFPGGDARGLPRDHGRHPAARRRAARRVRGRGPQRVRQARERRRRAVDPDPRVGLRRPLPQGRRLRVHHGLVRRGLPEAERRQALAIRPVARTRIRTTAAWAGSSWCCSRSAGSWTRSRCSSGAGAALDRQGRPVDDDQAQRPAVLVRARLDRECEAASPRSTSCRPTTRSSCHDRDQADPPDRPARVRRRRIRWRRGREQRRAEHQKPCPDK